MSSLAKVHVLLTDEYVAVANTGRPFSREGLRAVCGADLSPKGVATEDILFAKISEANEFLEKIQNEQVGAYNSRPRYIDEEAEREKKLQREYAARVLPELVQNAHDAATDHPIGKYGVGFKAVLNISDEPRIHSGQLHCRFNRELAREKLSREGLLKGEGNDVPLLRLPFPTTADDEPGPIRSLIKDYHTVIVLPFFGEQGKEGRERFLEEWEDCAEDSTLPLFLPAINRIIFERISGKERRKKVWHRRSKNPFVEIFDEDKPDVPARWKLYSSEEASVAIRVDDDGTLIPEEKHPQLRVFFRTEERSPIPILMHAILPLKEGRSNVLKDDPESRDEVEAKVRELARHVRTALAGERDPGRLIDLLRPRDLNQMEGVEKRLWEAIKIEVAILRIPGTRSVKLGQVRLRPVIQETAMWFNCAVWNEFKTLLSRFRKGKLTGLNLLPPGTDTVGRENTILAFNPHARLSVDELRNLPLLPVEEDSEPFAAGSTNIFFPPKHLTQRPPRGIEIRFLDSRLNKALEKLGKGNRIRAVLKDVLGVSEFRPLDLVEKAVLPVLRDGQQPVNLLGFLTTVVVPALEKEDLIFDWREPIRKELAERCRVPLRNGATLFAVHVYAGSEWTGSKFLDQAYGGCSDRGFLHPPPTDLNERKRQEKLYRWLGVGWCPKVMPIVCEADGQGTRKGLEWNKDVFGIAEAPGDWSDYCATLDKDRENRRRKTRLRQNWTLDDGQHVLLIDGTFKVINENWNYYKNYQEAIYYRSNNMKSDDDNWRKTGQSYFNWLLQEMRWVPVKNNKKRKMPRDVFVRSEVSRELVHWIFEIDATAADEFLKAIGIRSGWKELTNEDWHRWLGRATEHGDEKVNGNKELRRQILRLYEAGLQHWSPKDYLPKGQAKWSGPAWCVERLPDNTETWHLSRERSNVYFVDRPDLELLRLPSLRVFPVRLGGHEKEARDRFGLRMLSEHLSGVPMPGAVMTSCMDYVKSQIVDRLDYLHAYVETVQPERSSFIARDRLNTFNLKVISGLHIQFSLDGIALGKPEPLEAYYQANEAAPILWLDGSLFNDGGQPMMGAWDWVGTALMYTMELPNGTDTAIKDVLSYPDKELQSKLLKLGVTKEAVDRIVLLREELARAGDASKLPDEDQEKVSRVTVIPPDDGNIIDIDTRDQGGSSEGARNHEGEQSVDIKTATPQSELHLKDPANSEIVTLSPGGKQIEKESAGDTSGGGGGKPREAEILDDEAKRRIEKRARQCAIYHLRQLGYAVEKMPFFNPGYDLRATKGSHVLLVEVKGHRGEADVVDLTVREFKEFLRCTAEGSTESWQLWNVENLSNEFDSPSRITRYDTIPEQALAIRGLKVDLRECRLVANRQ